MEIQEIIEKAIEGEWAKFTASSFARDEFIEFCIKNIEVALLDKDFWQAVGKVEGWNGKEYFSGKYKRKMHQMIDALIDGKSVEEYIKTL